MVGVARQHAWAFAVVGLAAAAAGLFLTTFRPRYHPAIQKLPSVPLPYSHAEFTVADAERAFAAVGVRLVPKSRQVAIATVGTADDAFEVDIFGDPARVNAMSGSPEVITDAHGNYVRIPRTCTAGIPDAERWLGNVRFIVRCTNPTHAHLLALGSRALRHL